MWRCSLFFNSIMKTFVRQMVERVLTGKVRSLFAIYPTKIPLPLLASILPLLSLILSRVFKIAIFWTSAKLLTRAGGDRGCALLIRPGVHQVIVLVCSLCCSLCCSLWRSLASGVPSRRCPHSQFPSRAMCSSAILCSLSIS